jgi:hypothetical protein
MCILAFFSLTVKYFTATSLNAASLSCFTKRTFIHYYREKKVMIFTSVSIIPGALAIFLRFEVLELALRAAV